MFKLFVTAIILTSGVVSFADGFVCDDQNDQLNIKVFHHVNPDLGTRNAAVMILSEPNGKDGLRTRAVLRQESKALANEGSKYVGYLGLREDAYLHRDARIVNKLIEDLYSVILKVDFSYSHPVPPGSQLEGEVIFVDRNGDRIYIDVGCRRYLKGHEEIKKLFLEL